MKVNCPNLNIIFNASLKINVSSASIAMPQQHLFADLDKDDIGFIHYNDLVEMWVSEGVPDPKHVLQVAESMIKEL